MTTYIVLGNFTDHGIRTVNETTRRADTFKDLAKSLGVSVKEIYWTLGSFDTVTIVDAPDEASITAVGLALGKAGNLRTQTLRAFSRAEIETILKKVS